MTVLVTGGAGFIGSHVVDALREAGMDVICIDSLDPGVHHALPSYLRADVDYCFIDLRHWTPDTRFRDVEAVVHLAALGGVSRAGREPANIIDCNCGGTARLVEAMRNWRRLQRVVLVSSFSVYGANYTYQCAACELEFDGTRRVSDLEVGRFEVICSTCGGEATILPITEEASPRPLEVYGASKYMQELCFRGFAHAAVTILRLSSVTIIARIAGWIRSGQRPRLFEDGRQIRDWVYVGDVVDAVRALLGGNEAPSLINVCSGVPTRLIEACERIAAVLEMDCPPEIVGGYRPGDMRHCLGDPSALRTLLGRDPLAFKDAVSMAFDRRA